MRNLGWLLKANLKVDFKTVLIWFIVIMMMLASGASKLTTLYSTAAEQQQLLTMLKTPVMAILFAPITSTHSNLAILFAGIMLPLLAVLVALLNIQLTLHGTRKMEESGETELLLSTAMTKRLPIKALVVEVLLVNLLISLFTWLVLMLVAIPGSTEVGNGLVASLLFSVGMFFSGITFIGAQLFMDSQSVALLGYGSLGGFYLLRALVDINDWSSLKVLSPFNWLTASRVYDTNNGWGSVALLATGLILMGITLGVVAQRDLGIGLIKTHHQGRAQAPALLKNFTGLLWRSMRKMVLGWLLGILLVAIMFGSLFSGLADLITTNPLITKVLGVAGTHTAISAVYTHFWVMVSLVIALFAILAGLGVVQQYQRDCRSGALDLLSAQPITRANYYGHYVLGGALTTIVAWSLGLLVAWFVAQQTVAVPLATELLSRMFWGYLPVVLTFISLAGLCIGWLPQAVGIVYIYTGLMFLLTYLQGLFNIPTWVLKFAPFGWVHNVPVVGLSLSHMLGLLLVCLVCSILGWGGFKRRNLV